MSDKEDFEEQLRQEQIAKETEQLDKDRTRVDPDGTAYEWDPVKKAWFPKIDADFIAQYQMNYGAENKTSESTAESSSTTTEPATTDPNYLQNYYNYYAQSGSDVTKTTDSKEYAEWYYYYYGNQARNRKDSETASVQSEISEIPPAPEDINSEEYFNWYHTYYGEQESSKPEPTTDQDEFWEQYLVPRADGGAPKVSTEGDKKKKDVVGKKDAKRKAEHLQKPPEPPSWFEVDEGKNTNVYVSGLPQEMTFDEFKELMTKCGLVMFDPLTRKPKLKLYKDEAGQNKGDGRCCYIKPESVDLALQILDGSEYNGHKIYVERAKFELKGKFDATKRRRKLTKNEKKKFQQKQEKLFDWRPDKPLGTRERWERIVILKNVFDPKEFEQIFSVNADAERCLWEDIIQSLSKDPLQINEYRKDLQEECAKYGEVKKVQVYDRHVDGVVGITFKEPEEADVCVEALNGRWFAKRQLSAANHDGKTKYHVNETDKEQEERLKQWENYLEGKEPGAKTSTSAASDDKAAIEGADVKTSADSSQNSQPNESEATTSTAQAEAVVAESSPDYVSQGETSQPMEEGSLQLAEPERCRQEVDTAVPPDGAAASGAECE